MSPTVEFSTPTYAIVSERADIDAGGAERALDTFLGTVRIRSESSRAVFLGIGPAAAVDRYLARVERDVVTGFDSGFGSDDPTYSRRAGAAPSGPPDAQTFWAASQTGAGEQTIQWDPEDGTWRTVVMNVDAARGVSADMSIGAELDSVLWIGLGLLAVGGLLAAGAALAITAGARRRGAPRLTTRGRKAASSTTSGQGPSPMFATSRVHEAPLTPLLIPVGPLSHWRYQASAACSTKPCWRNHWRAKARRQRSACK